MADDWSRIECEAIVEDHFDMLLKELSGAPYSKSEHRYALQGKLDSRSEGSIEYKHQNITAVLLKAGYTYIKGYKPAWNYQGKYQPFLITSNEVEFSESNSDQYALYRAYEFSEKPRIFTLTGRITDNINIVPKIFRASF